jgi:hypothetical protein
MFELKKPEAYAMGSIKTSTLVDEGEDLVLRPPISTGI